MFDEVNFELLSNSRVAVHCARQEQADHFVSEMKRVFPEKCKHWRSGNSWWRDYEKDTCYDPGIFNYDQLGYCSLGWFSENGYKIVEFDDVVERPQDLPMGECEFDIKSLFGME